MGKGDFHISPKRAQEYFDDAKSRLDKDEDEDELPQSTAASTRAADFIENYEKPDEVVGVDSGVEKKESKQKNGCKKKKADEVMQEATDSCRLAGSEDHEDDEEDEDEKEKDAAIKPEDKDEDDKGDKVHESESEEL